VKFCSLVYFHSQCRYFVYPRSPDCNSELLTTVTVGDQVTYPLINLTDGFDVMQIVDINFIWNRGWIVCYSILMSRDWNAGT
jgi:hypothetical protein